MKTSTSDGRILGFDPGLLDAGAAIMERGRLTAAWWLRPQTPQSTPCWPCERRGRACAHGEGPALRGAMLAELLRLAGPLGGYDLVVLEGQYLPSRVRLFDPAPLLDLAAIAGAVAALAWAAGAPSVLYPPSDWKGHTDKATFQREILACLDTEELALVPMAPRTGRYLSDAVDAVGLTLHAVGRLGRWQQDPADFAGQVEEQPARGRKRKATTGKVGTRTKRRAPAQGGFTFATGPGGTPAALHADDVDALFAEGVR